MHPDLVEIGWTEEQWNRIVTTVTEEAQKGRVAAQFLPVSGPEAPSTVAVPNYSLISPDKQAPPPSDEPKPRLAVDSDPTLYLQTIAVNVPLRTREVGDPELKAALVMFRRAANLIARVEDALIFSGRHDKDTVQAKLPHQIGLGTDGSFDVNPQGDAKVVKVEGQVPGTGIKGIFPHIGVRRSRDCRTDLPAGNATDKGYGQTLVTKIVDAIQALEKRMQLGPFACVLGHDLFSALCSPSDSMVLPRDRVLPFLQGPLVRTSTVDPKFGAVIALSGSPIEIVAATDLGVRFLQTTLEPRFVFRVSERVALRLEDDRAIQVLVDGTSEYAKKAFDGGKA
jgi:uncharacterized linocin/CFP29 family protein